MVRRLLHKALFIGLLVLPVSIIFSCTDENIYDETDNNNKTTTVDIAFAIPRSTGTSTPATRLLAQEVQRNNTYYGIKNIDFWAVKQTENSMFADSNSVFFQDIEALSQLPTTFEDEITEQGVHSGVSILRNVSLPISDYDKMRYVFYGETNYPSPQGKLTRTPAVADMAGQALKKVRFSLNEIPQIPATRKDSIEDAIENIFEEMDSCVQYYLSRYSHADSMLGNSLQLVLDTLVGKGVTAKEYPISDYGLQLLFSNIYAHYEIVGLIDATQLPDLNAVANYSIVQGRFVPAVKSAYLLSGRYPTGSYFLTLQKIGAHTYSAEITARTDALNSTIMQNDYSYPASLWYYGNGFLVEEISNFSGNVTSHYDINNWIDYSNIYQGYNITNILNPERTINIAYSHTIQYGVGLAQTTVILNNAKAAKASYTAGEYVQTNEKFSIGNGGLILTGILFGNLHKEADCFYEPVDTSALTTIYDIDLVGKSQYSVQLSATSTNVEGVSLATGQNNSICYTLLLPTRKIDGVFTDDSINVALELVNNTGETFIGINTNPVEPIRPGATFYVVGTVVYSKVSTGAGTNKADRLFKSDYTTQLNMTIGDLTNAYLYTTLPNLTNIINGTSLYIDVSWTQGDPYVLKF